MVVDKFLPKLSQNLLEILEDDEYYDITIEVGNNPYIKVFRSHMVILYYRSPYLRRILSTNKRKNDGTLVHIKLPNILPEIFQIILRYIYGGKLSLGTYDTLDIIKILEAANELSLQELITYLEDYLIENKANWIEQNFNLINQTSFGHDSLLKLQKFCTDLMSKEPEKIFKSLDFVSIPEKSLISLIQNDNLQMSEVQVWGHVLRWGLAQNPELSSDTSNYSKDDFNVLKNSLQQCIPFIRFYNLTSKEFLNEVYPCKKVLSKELREDLIKCFLGSGYKPIDKSRPRGVNKGISTNIESKIISDNLSNTSRPHGVSGVTSANIDSIIISNKHVELISKWIDKVDVSERSYRSYRLKLILRGSRDGFAGKRIHEICHNKARTVSIIKVKDNNEILGGYNPFKWKTPKNAITNIYGSSGNSFIFSFKGEENYILSRVNNEKRAINNWVESGPSFGLSDLITFSPNGSYCIKEDYEEHIRESDGNFSVEEIEVFQIIL